MTTNTKKSRTVTEEKSSITAQDRTTVLATFRDPTASDFDHAWLGLEPTFQSRKSVQKWLDMSVDEEGEDAYFSDSYMLGKQQKIAKEIVRSWRKRRSKKDADCFFDTVERKKELDQWDAVRQNLQFHWDDKELDDFEVKWSIDPETFEYSIKPVPLVWLYNERFVAFLEKFVWGPPLSAGLAPSMAHGGAQFSISAKTFLGGSLLADVITDKLNHPELSTWLMDWPNPDDRSFRATPGRLAAFERVLNEYWEGAYHPRARGRELTPIDVYLDRDFVPAAGQPGLVHSKTGPVGSAREIFQTNFAFGRAVRLRAQNVHPGYWQAAHLEEIGYRPDQIMRYSEGNLNRLQIAGEFHVKSGETLDPDRVPSADAPLEQSMLYGEASWENRAQMGRTSARDFVEAVLLDVHTARRLAANPGVRVIAAGGLLQDQILVDAEATIRKHAGDKILGEMRKKAERDNLAASHGRLKSGWIEPEELLWAAWKALPQPDKAAIAVEIVETFTAYVEGARAYDPRHPQGDPMEWHRHRVHPELWKAIGAESSRRKGRIVSTRELEKWQADRKIYEARRPVFSPLDISPPWK